MPHVRVENPVKRRRSRQQKRASALRAKLYVISMVALALAWSSRAVPTPPVVAVATSKSLSQSHHSTRPERQPPKCHIQRQARATGSGHAGQKIDLGVLPSVQRLYMTLQSLFLLFRSRPAVSVPEDVVTTRRRSVLELVPAQSVPVPELLLKSSMGPQAMSCTSGLEG